jgi:hypothetical protein
MKNIEHSFTKKIKEILRDEFREKSELIYSCSLLLQYINIKTRSAESGSKSRGSFGNLYATYVLVEDYITKNFHIHDNYQNYEGAKFVNLLRRQRELPFGKKLQNHALNHRLNEEFKKFFPTSIHQPITRDVTTESYWINENLLKLNIDDQIYNIAETIIKIINSYIESKQQSMNNFLHQCEQIKKLPSSNYDQQINFIVELLQPNIDARLFEIVSFSILKYYYHDQIVYFGFDIDDIKPENLQLYKTGRTNANDGGIDFVMKPLGRFFQVTETTDVRKYFLDIDKIERYPITFVIKSELEVSEIFAKIKQKAQEQYGINVIVNKYMNAIEEIINLQILVKHFNDVVNKGYIHHILDEIILQTKVEFNYEE